MLKRFAENISDARDWCSLWEIDRFNRPAPVDYQSGALFCDPSHFAGSYALQLTGTTTISGDEKPATNLSRLVFAEEGKVSGVSSTSFSGYLLGNPVTGSDELGIDCSLNWKLQDDSDAWQHFAGKLMPDLASGQFR